MSMETDILECAVLVFSYKLWHYTGSLLAHVPTTEGQELWDVQWQPVPEGTFKEKPVRYKPSEPGLASPENSQYIHSDEKIIIYF